MAGKHLSVLVHLYGAPQDVNRGSGQIGTTIFTVIWRDNEEQESQIDLCRWNARPHSSVCIFAYEFREFLDKYQIEYDKRYLWD